MQALLGTCRKLCPFHSGRRKTPKDWRRFDIFGKNLEMHSIHCWNGMFATNLAGKFGVNPSCSAAHRHAHTHTDMFYIRWIPTNQRQKNISYSILQYRCAKIITRNNPKHIKNHCLCFPYCIPVRYYHQWISIRSHFCLVKSDSTKLNHHFTTSSCRKSPILFVAFRAALPTKHP